MQIVELKYKTFSFPLHDIVKTSQLNIAKKKVIILKTYDSKGNIAFAEVSPLENFSKETIEECENYLNKFVSDEIKFPMEFDELKKLAEIFKMVPSLKFSFEQLLLNWYLLREEKKYINFPKKNKIKINRMISIKPLEEAMYEVSGMFEKGYNVIKLKIGRKDFTEDLNLIKKIKEKYNNEIKLRLDVNGKWNCNEAIERLEELNEFDIEYIEEPVETKDELISLAAVSKHNLVPDESIETYEDAVEFIETGYFDFIVLKPLIRIGIFDTIKIIKLAEEKNINVIITSAFETAIGRSALLYLASLTSHNYAHGLGVDLLGENILQNPFMQTADEVSFKINKFPPEFNLDF